MSDDFFEKVGTRPSPNRPHAAGVVSVGYANEVARAAPEQGSMALTGAKRWASSFDKFWGAHKTHDELPAGVYRCGEAPGIGVYMERKSIDVDSLIEFPDAASAQIIGEFDQFWAVEKEFRARGFVHKRGFMLWGPPGSGKTSTINILLSRLVNAMDGIVVLAENPELTSHCLQMARSIEPRRPIVCIMEDMDALVERYGENQYLALLDGEAQVDSIVFIATTNYPEKLDRRFVDRPSRFDTIKYIPMPSREARQIYLEAKERWIDQAELDHWVDATEGFSVAHLKELIVAVRCLRQPFAEALGRLEKMRYRKPSSEEAPGRIAAGFMGFREAAE